MGGVPGLLVALAWALLDSPRRPGALRPMGWWPACSLSPATLWAAGVRDVSRRGSGMKAPRPLGRLDCS